MGTLEKFRTYYPEFAGVSDAIVSEIISDVSLEFIPAKWGPYFPRGVIALTAHLLAIRARSAAAGLLGGDGTGAAAVGSVNSVKTGDLSIAYGGSASVAGKAEASLSDAVLAQTPYGQEYLRLRGRLFIGPVVA